VTVHPGSSLDSFRLTVRDVNGGVVPVHRTSSLDLQTAGLSARWVAEGGPNCALTSSLSGHLARLHMGERQKNVPSKWI